MGIKAYNSFEEAIENMVHYSVTFEPDMANHKIYADIFKNVYSKIYKQLKPMYKNIKDILTN